MKVLRRAFEGYTQLQLQIVKDQIWISSWLVLKQSNLCKETLGHWNHSSLLLLWRSELANFYFSSMLNYQLVEEREEGSLQSHFSFFTQEEWTSIFLPLILKCCHLGIKIGWINKFHICSFTICSSSVVQKLNTQKNTFQCSLIQTACL